MSEFLQRLKARKLVQWTIAYAAFAFALLQGLDVVAQQFGWPDELRRGITLVLALGFFVALVLAWYHGERGAQRISGTEVLILALLLAVGGGLLWRYARVTHGVGASLATSNANPPAFSPVAISAKSIAVLPLANESGDKGEEYFSDGLSEDLITALSQFAGLKVISRNSSFQFRNSADDSRTIGEKLGVAHLLEGSVQHAGDMVRISAELVNAADGSTVWSQRYDRPYKDLFALQDDITSAVADALKTKLLATGGASAQSDRPPSGNLAAYSAYLQGRYYFFRHTQEDTRKAFDYYNQAVALDPEYAQAYAELAITEVQTIAIFSASNVERSALIAKARAAAKTALALQPDLGVAHYAQAFILQIVDFDLAAAAAEYRRAADLDPQDSPSALSLGIVNASFGRLDAAVKYGLRAVALDPLNSVNYIYLARSLIVSGRYDEAGAALRKAIAAHPQAAQTYSQLAVLQILRGNSVAAVNMAKQETDPFWRVYALALADFADGDKAGADAALKEMLDKYPDGGAFQIAEVYALRKQPDKMFEWLDHGLATRDPGVTTLLYAPFVGAYKDDPRFAAFCGKLGLPAPGAVPASAGSAPSTSPE